MVSVDNVSLALPATDSFGRGRGKPKNQQKQKADKSLGCPPLPSHTTSKSVGKAPDLWKNMQEQGFGGETGERWGEGAPFHLRASSKELGWKASECPFSHTTNRAILKQTFAQWGKERLFCFFVKHQGLKVIESL